MKKLIICLLVGITVISCNTSIPKATSNAGHTFEVIEVDSCEYLIRVSAYSGYFSHKGNCKYCIERAESKYE